MQDLVACCIAGTKDVFAWSKVDTIVLDKETVPLSLAKNCNGSRKASTNCNKSNQMEKWHPKPYINSVPRHAGKKRYKLQILLANVSSQIVLSTDDTFSSSFIAHVYWCLYTMNDIC